MCSRHRLIGLVVALALAATGCLGRDGGGDRAGPDTGAGFARADAPATGGTLRVGVTGIATLDPAAANAASASQMLVADLLFDGLTTFDPARSQVLGAVAEGWTGSADGLTWTFRIDRDARFADGRPITATDVKLSLERVVDLGVKSVSGLRLASVLGSLAATDALTLTVRLTTPFAALPELLADPVFGIVQASDASGGAFASDPVGSGPFVVRSRTASTITAARVTGSAARLDAVELRVFDDVAAAYAAFRDGELDVAPLPAGKAGEATSGGAQVIAAPHQVSLFYGMNLAAPSLQSPALRQAILKAVDRDAIRARYFDGVADVMTGVIGPSVAGRRDNGCGSACAYDPAAARALLGGAFGAAPVPTVRVDYFDEPTGREAGVAAMIAGYLQAAGIAAEARAYPFEEYQQVPASGRAELFRFGWIGSYPSADAYLTPLFASAGTDNVFSVNDPELDALLGAARASDDATARVTKYLAAEDRVFALAPLLPIVQYRVQLVASPRVRDVQLGPNGAFDAVRVYLAAP